MSVETLVLREHEDIVFPRNSLSAEILRELRDQFGIRCTVRLGGNNEDEVVLNSESQAGVLVLSDGTTVELRPKTPIANIFWMWEIAFGIDLKFDWSQTTKLSYLDELYSRLADVFIMRIRRLMALGLYRSYRAHSEQLRTVRGRLDLGRHLSRSWSPSLPCRYEEHEADNMHNRLLLWSLVAIFRSCAIREETRMRAVAVARYLMQSVAVEPQQTRTYSQQRYDRLNMHYRPLHALGRFFVEFAGPSLTGSLHGLGVPFLVNMPLLYENFVACWLQQNLPSPYELSIHPSRKLGTSSYRMVPDLVLYTSKPERRAIAVLDTKYKVGERVSESDLYQAVAYATEFGVDTAWLVYPTLVSDAGGVPVGDSVTVKCSTFRIDGDLDQAGQEFLKVLGM